MTSNAGSEKKEAALGFAKTEEDASKERAMKALADFLRPEFLSRVDEIVVFKPLSIDDYQKIAGLMLNEYIGSLKERGITLQYDAQATRWLAEHAHGGKSGARDLRNLIRREVEDRIASTIVESNGAALSGVFVTVDEKNQILVQTL